MALKRIAPGRAAVFVDKDGTLLEDLPFNVDPQRARFTPNALQALALLARRGYRLFVVTNQPGIAWGRFDAQALERLHQWLARTMREAGAQLDGFYACPHAPSADPRGIGCLCRKPEPGLLLQAAREHGLDLARSWMVGDILNDVEAGRRAGCRSVLLDVGHETEWLMSPLREPHRRVRDLLEAAHAIHEEDSHAPVDLTTRAHCTPALANEITTR